jgi:hypothetical protein
VSKPSVSAASVRAAPLVFDAARTTLIALRFWELPTGHERFMAANALFEHLGLVGGFLLVAWHDLKRPGRVEGCKLYREPCDSVIRIAAGVASAMATIEARTEAAPARTVGHGRPGCRHRRSGAEMM